MKRFQKSSNPAELPGAGQFLLCLDKPEKRLFFSFFCDIVFINDRKYFDYQEEKH